VSQDACPFPEADPQTGLEVLKAFVRRRSPLAALEVMQAQVGNAFRVNLPVFNPAFVAGPENNREVLVSQRHRFLWRNERDPVTRLLRHGLLVEDQDSHDRLRAIMDPALYRREVLFHIGAMRDYTDTVLDTWQDGQVVDMLVEMRRAALLILMGTLFKVDFRPDIDRLWPAILKTLKYISPGLWLLWPGAPRPGYAAALQAFDDYLYGIIDQRRQDVGETDDLLGSLIAAGLDDDLIRDQLITMLIAGHDTSTALLAWALYLLGRHPEALAQAQVEVDAVLGSDQPTWEQLQELHFLDQVIKEALRLYPPIHVGNRQALEEMTLGGYHVPAGTRVMYSIYLSHRDPEHWPEPDAFRPERFDYTQRENKTPPFTYVPFGGGPRNCIGAAFAQVEAKVVLGRILQRFNLELAVEHI
jgi:cytochrome P450